jgi:mRNA interferase RelE/StbE
MSWTLEFTKQAEKQFQSLDKHTQSKIKKAISEKLLTNPNIYLKSLLGDKSGLYKFRVGDYRLLCFKERSELVIMVVKVRHRKDVYLDK